MRWKKTKTGGWRLRVLHTFVKIHECDGMFFIKSPLVFTLKSFQTAEQAMAYAADCLIYLASQIYQGHNDYGRNELREYMDNGDGFYSEDWKGNG